MRRLLLIVTMALGLFSAGCEEEKSLYEKHCDLRLDCNPASYVDEFGSRDIGVCVETAEWYEDRLSSDHGSDCVSAFRARQQCWVDVGCVEVMPDPPPCEEEEDRYYSLCDI